nr:hypothetical protein L204_06195 [Cryptococcus depauperatus CBS 7855]
MSNISNRPTPTPTSPPPFSESFLSDLDDIAPSLLETTLSIADYPQWEAIETDPKNINLVSWKLDVSAKDGVEGRGFNAISTVLNHPKKKSNPLRASKKPLPPLQAPPAVPKPPPPSYYDAYLSSITPLHDTFTSIQSSLRGAGELEEDAEKAHQELPILNNIPPVFFDTDFDLSSPTTWSELVPSSTLPDPNLQDELSNHLDTLERHLLHEITLRSTSFFSALSNLQDLHSESASCLSHITSLQESLKAVGQGQAKRGLEIIDAQAELANLKLIARAVESIGEVEDIRHTAERLAGEGDWEGSLGCVESLAAWWPRYSAEPLAKEEMLALTTLPALSELPTEVAQLLNIVSTHLVKALTTYLSSLLFRPIEHSASKEELMATLAPMLEGLIKCGTLELVEGIWGDVVVGAIREESRKCLPSSEEEDAKQSDARGCVVSLAQSLQVMDHSTFFLLCTQLYGSLSGRLRIVKQIGAIMENAVIKVSKLRPLYLTSSSHFNSYHAPSISLSDILTSAVELSHTRISKIISVRAEQHVVLKLEEFLELYKEAMEFIKDTEDLAGRGISPLRNVLSQQARSFVSRYHAEKLTKSAKAVEEEQWTQIDVTAALQNAVKLIVQSAISDPPEYRIPPPQINKQEQEAPNTKQLRIEEKPYFIVKATAETLILLKDYLKVIVNLESVVTEVMSRIIEFLKSFNSRTCQVVLGAGAMRSAGLKNITAKHLALASQSLSVVVALVDYVKEFVRRHADKVGGLLGEFDKLKRDYQEHQNEIHVKLVAIMSDRLAVHCASLRETNWDSDTSKDGPSSYAEMLVKETATLHKVLSKYLASETVETVLSEVVVSITTRLIEEYSRIEVTSEEGKVRMLQDITLISSRLKPLSERKDEVEALEQYRGRVVIHTTSATDMEENQKEETQVDAEEEAHNEDT